MLTGEKLVLNDDGDGNGSGLSLSPGAGVTEWFCPSSKQHTRTQRADGYVTHKDQVPVGGNAAANSSTAHGMSVIISQTLEHQRLCASCSSPLLTCQR